MNRGSVDQKRIVSNTRARMLPLGPVEKILEWLVTLLPRKYEDARVEVFADVQPRDAASDEYLATTDDPAFILALRSARIRGGWYYMEAVLSRHRGDRVSKIYFDRGDGFCEDNVIRIPSALQGTIREVFCLPGDVRQLRWDPTESAGIFTQSALVVHKITALEALLRRAYSVLRAASRPSRGLRCGQGDPTWRLLFNVPRAYNELVESRLRQYRPDTTYEEFIGQNDTLSASDIRAIQGHVVTLPVRPRISIIMPVYNPDISHLKSAIESVVAQYYPNWELCIADDASTAPEVRKVIRKACAEDERIKAVFRTENGHISAASNSALQLASGEFIALLDQDDMLPPHALYHVAVEIIRHPDCALIYSDEDKIGEDGIRTDPYFKPDWNPDLFCSHNMITHLGVYHTRLVRALGGFRVGYEGSQDYDLARRLIEVIPSSQIRHIPRVLYHWRVHAASTSLHGAGNKLYAYEAAQNTLNEFLAQHRAYAAPGPHLGSYRAVYPIPEAEPLVTLIIPTRDKVQVLSACVESILHKTQYKNWELLIVDNRSTETKALAYLDRIGQNKKVRVVKYDREFNYSAVNNFAVRHARGRLLGLVNNDVEVVTPEWLGEMVSHALRPEIGAVGAKLLYPDGLIQHAGVILGLGGLAAHSHRLQDSDAPGYFGYAQLIRNYSAVTGACLVVRREVYEEVGGLDEENLPVAYNDVDFCLRVMERGYRNLYTPYAVLYHHESYTRGKEESPVARARLEREARYMRRRWGALLDADPAYNPNLTRGAENLALNPDLVVSSHHDYPLKIDHDV